ncbi:MAG: pilus assembly protein [Clostridiales bacterium]|nr:pilus assembly protein [Clostridiales bacterium]
MKKGLKGALALEAAIAFTVFLCFMFILMAVVRLAMVYITINDVTSETAKRIAGMSYIVQFVNDLYDDKVSDLEDAVKVKKFSFKAVKKTSNASSSSTSSVLQYLGLNITNKALNLSGLQDTIDNFTESTIESILGKAESFVMDKQQELLYSVYTGLLEETGASINSDDVTVVFFTLPLSETAFDNQKEAIAETTGFGEDDLNRNDVILIVEYNYTINVPFFPSYDVTLRSTAVERAWVNGGSHVTPSDRESVDISSVVGKIVYHTPQGKKYHK